jgi:hypothetical protein
VTAQGVDHVRGPILRDISRVGDTDRQLPPFVQIHPMDAAFVQHFESEGSTPGTTTTSTPYPVTSVTRSSFRRPSRFESLRDPWASFAGKSFGRTGVKGCVEAPNSTLKSKTSI